MISFDSRSIEKIIISRYSAVEQIYNLFEKIVSEEKM